MIRKFTSPRNCFRGGAGLPKFGTARWANSLKTVFSDGFCRRRVTSDSVDTDANRVVVLSAAKARIFSAICRRHD